MMCWRVKMFRESLRCVGHSLSPFGNYLYD